MIIFIYLYISRFIKYVHHPLWMILQKSYHKELELNRCISLPNLSQFLQGIQCTALVQSQHSEPIWEQGNKILYVRALMDLLPRTQKTSVP